MQTINIIAETQNKDQIDALKSFLKSLNIKFELTKTHETKYDSDFVMKINKSEEACKNGKYTIIKPDDLDKYIDEL